MGNTCCEIQTEKYFLDLRNNALESIPSKVYTLSNLESLDVSSNSISKIDSDLKNLNILVFCSFSQNLLVDLPQSFNFLTKLKMFFFFFFFLTIFFLFLRLLLDGNLLHSLPEAIFTLANLEILDVSNNQISTIPPSIGNLTKLREVNFSKNYLRLVFIFIFYFYESEETCLMNYINAQI
jgi:Leucine-rich repeat (LRR) protein